MSQMKNLANSPRGRMAKTQEDLIKIAMNKSPFREEVLEDHPLALMGFTEYSENGIERMRDSIFHAAVRNLMKVRPTAHLWDIKPYDLTVKEDKVFMESSEAFGMTYEERATFLQEEYLRRPEMVGFKIELHNVFQSGTANQGPASMSLSIYESTEEILDMTLPLEIKCRWRTNF